MATKQKPKSTNKKPAKKIPAKRTTRKIPAKTKTRKIPAKKTASTVSDRQARRAIVCLAALVRGQYSRLSSNNQELARTFLVEADKCES